MVKKLQIDVRIFVNESEYTWGELCRTYPDQAEEVLDQMQIILEGNASITLQIEEPEKETEKPTPKIKASRRYGGRISVQEKVIALISEHQGITAEEIMAKLKTKNKKVVWQAVFSLRKKGYRIMVDPENRGYRLIF